MNYIKPHNKEVTSMANKSKKRMRLPNGFGSVHQIGGNKRRRKPWRARVPSHIEFDEDTGTAKRKYITIGYYETEKEAILALTDYVKNPYTADAATITFADVFEMWSAKKYPDISKSGQGLYNTAYKHSTPLHKMKMKDIKTIHLEQIMTTVKGGFKTQSNIKSFWSQLFKYAIEHDIVEKNFALTG